MTNLNFHYSYGKVMIKYFLELYSAMNVLNCLRLSLIYKLITLFENNLKLRNNKVKFFETGRVFQKNCNKNFLTKLCKKLRLF